MANSKAEQGKYKMILSHTTSKEGSAQKYRRMEIYQKDTGVNLKKTPIA